MSPGCWRTTAGEDASEEMRYLAVRHVLKIAADKAFQALCSACPDLLVIIMDDVTGEFGYDLRGTTKWPPAFIRSKQTDPLGRTMYVAAPIDYDRIKVYEPCFDLQDTPSFVYA